MGLGGMRDAHRELERGMDSCLRDREEENVADGQAGGPRLSGRTDNRGSKAEWARGVVGHTGGDMTENIPKQAGMLSRRVPAGAPKQKDQRWYSTILNYSEPAGGQGRSEQRFPRRARCVTARAVPHVRARARGVKDSLLGWR